MDEIRFLHQQADECRRAAEDMSHSFERRALRQLARHYEQEARRLNLAEIDNRNVILS